MTRTARAGLRLLAVALPVALLAPGAAHAEKVVTDDLVGDVQAFDVADPDLAWVPQPDHASTDIVRTAAAYGTSRLRVTVHYRDLVNTWLLNTSVRIRTADHKFDFVAVRRPGSRMEMKLFRGRGDEVVCRGLRATYGGDADVVVMSVPSACFGTPRWVQLGVGAMGADSAIAEDAESFLLHFDDGRSNAFGDDGLVIGPRIRRG